MTIYTYFSMNLFLFVRRETKSVSDLVSMDKAEWFSDTVMSQLSEKIDSKSIDNKVLCSFHTWVYTPGQGAWHRVVAPEVFVEEKLEWIMKWINQEFPIFYYNASLF